MIVYHLYYHQFHIILVVMPFQTITDKNIYGYILRSTDNHPLESFEMLAKDNEAGQRTQHET